MFTFIIAREEKNRLENEIFFLKIFKCGGSKKTPRPKNSITIPYRTIPRQFNGKEASL